MKIKVILITILITILAAGLYIGYRYQAAPAEEKKLTRKEKIELYKNMSLQAVFDQEFYSRGTWREIFQETNLYQELADTSKFFILLVVPTEIMVAPFIATDGAIKNCLENWNKLPLEKKISLAKNYIIPTKELWAPKNGSVTLKTLGGKKIIITTKNADIYGETEIVINGVPAIDYVIAHNGIMLIMRDIIWKEDHQALSC